MQKLETGNEPKSRKLPTTTCPGCGMTWLVPGLLADDDYHCRSCGVRYVIDGDLDRVFVDREGKPSPVDGEALSEP